MWPHKHDGGQQLAGHALAKEAQRMLDLTSTGEPHCWLRLLHPGPFLLTSSSSPTARGQAPGNPSFPVCPQPQGSRPHTAPGTQPSTSHTSPFPGTPNCCSEEKSPSGVILLCWLSNTQEGASVAPIRSFKQAWFMISNSKLLVFTLSSSKYFAHGYICP